MSLPEAVTPDVPLRLDAAARLAFPDGSITVSSLRREAARGRLKVWRIAGKDMTTLAAVREMMDQCLVLQSPSAFGSDQHRKTESPSGSSSTRDVDIARAAAQMRVAKLKESSPNTSEKSTTPPPPGRVLPLKRR